FPHTRWRRAARPREGAAEGAREDPRAPAAGVRLPRSCRLLLHHGMRGMKPILLSAAAARAPITVHQSRESLRDCIAVLLPPLAGSRCAFAFRQLHLERLVLAQVDEVVRPGVVELLQVCEQRLDPAQIDAGEEGFGGLVRSALA